MIDRYLERGEMFVARDDGQVVAECVVTDEADRIGTATHDRFIIDAEKFQQKANAKLK